MKRCPECRRDYYDDTLSFCLDDGNALLEGPATAILSEPGAVATGPHSDDELKTAILSEPPVSAGGLAPSSGPDDEPATAILSEPPTSAGGQFDEPQTAILHTTDAVGDAPTRAQIHTTDQTAVLPSGTGDSDSKPRRHHKWLIAAPLLGVLIAMVAFAMYRFVFQDKPVTEHFKNVNLTRVTAEGAVESATISPDGKYIAYTLEESGKRSLWTKHLGSESRVQIVPPVESLSMFASAFSPDGGYVYYSRQDNQHPKGALYSVPVLGGMSRKIVSDVSQPVSVSRDGKQIVFGRYKLANTDDQLLIVNSDGTNERVLATVQEPEYLQGSAAAWSPDGTMIAIGYGTLVPEAAGPSPVYKMNVAVVSLADPQFKLITRENWSNVGSIKWLNDGTGLVFVAGERRSGAKQIWHCSYPSGETRRITNDLNSYDYDSLSITADDNAIVAVQKHPVSQIWVAPEGDTSRARAIVTRKNVQEGRYGLGWTADGRLVYDSSAQSNSSIWSIGADGAGVKQLTDGNTDDFGPEVSPDGRHIIFGAVRNGFQIWGMDIDGANQRQITHGTGTPTFSYSPDGRWIVFNPYLGGIFKMPADGGEQVEVAAEGPLVYPQVSPDGELLAYLVSDKDTKLPTINVLKFDGGALVRTFDLPVSTGTSYFESLSYRGFHWSPDGKGIVYIDTIGGVSNLWRQPLDGGPPKQITDFKTDRIFTFAFAPDEETIAFSRGSDTPDAVLITDVR